MGDEPLFQALLEERAFPEIDVRLRRGHHLDREQDRAAYGLLQRHEEAVVAYYRRYRCELLHHADGFWMLAPQGSQGQSVLRTRQLSRGQMMVGLALARIMIDPTSIQEEWQVSRERLSTTLEALFGTAEEILKVAEPQVRPHNRITATKRVQEAVDRALHDLSALGFVSKVSDDRYRLRPALARFLGPATEGDQQAALEDLASRSLILRQVPTLSAEAPDGVEPDDAASETLP